jgi:hypothetical protein
MENMTQCKVAAVTFINPYSVETMQASIYMGEDLSSYQEANLFLAQLELNFRGKGYMMNSAFSLNHSETTYLRCVSQNASHFIITPYLEDSSAVITIGNQILNNKQKSAEIELTDNYYEIVITVSDPESDLKRDYVLSIIRNFT